MSMYALSLVVCTFNSGAQPGLSKGGGRMVTSRPRRSDFDHFDRSPYVALGNEGKKLSATGPHIRAPTKKVWDYDALKPPSSCASAILVSC